MFARRKKHEKTRYEIFGAELRDSVGKVYKPEQLFPGEISLSAGLCKLAIFSITVVKGEKRGRRDERKAEIDGEASVRQEKSPSGDSAVR